MPSCHGHGGSGKRARRSLIQIGLRAGFQRKANAVRGRQDDVLERGRTYRPSALRQETRADNRRRIEAAAWDVFATKGLDGATVRDIVTQSGVSPGTFYNYYASLDAVFEIVLDRMVEQMREAVALVRPLDGTLEERLGRRLRAAFGFIAARPLGREFSERNQRHIRAGLHRIAATDSVLADIRADYLGDDQGDFTARFIFSIGLEALLLASSQCEVTIDEAIDRAIRILLHGLSG